MSARWDKTTALINQDLRLGEPAEISEAPPLPPWAEEAMSPAQRQQAMEAEADEPLPPGEAFERRVDRIRETLAAVRDRADMLGRRLAPVLLPERPQPVGEVRPAPESPLAVTLDEILTDVEDLHDRLRNLTHRIDL